MGISSFMLPGQMDCGKAKLYLKVQGDLGSLFINLQAIQ